MKNPRTRRTASRAVGAAVALLLLAGFLLAGSAHAWTVWRTCQGKYSVWGQLPSPFYVRMSRSFPDNSPPLDALNNARNQWQLQCGYLSYAGVSNGTTITHGDGVSQVYLTNQAALGTGITGTTWPVFQGCNWPDYNEHIVEMDVAVLQTLQFNEPDESGWNGTSDGQGRMVLLHEFGHAIGLQHYSAFDLMRPSDPRPFIGGDGSHAWVLPDDALGARTIYSGLYRPPNLVNLQASAQMLDSGGNVVNTAYHGTITKCPGDTFTMSFTVTNNGWSDLVFDQAFFLAPAWNYYGGGWQVGSWLGGRVNAYNAFTWANVAFQIPFGTQPGLWYVTQYVDLGNAINETFENDNYVHNVLTIQVIQC